MTLKELWMIIVRRKKLVVILPVICVLVCGIYLMLPKSSVTTESATAYIVGNSQVTGVAGLANTEVRQMAEELDEAEIEVSVRGDSNTMTVSVTARGENRDDCIEVANRVAEAAKDAAEEAYADWENPYIGAVERATEEIEKEDDSTGVNISLVLKYLVVALLAGLFVAVCIVVVLDMLKRPVKTPEGLQDAVELPVLEILPAANGERLLANVRFASNKPSVSSVLVVPTGDVKVAQTAADLLKSAASAEGAGADVEVTVARPLSEGMAGAYASRDVDAVVVAAVQWSDAIPQFESTVAELRLAGANLAGIVFSKGE